VSAATLSSAGLQIITGSAVSIYPLYAATAIRAGAAHHIASKLDLAPSRPQGIPNARGIG
jgi:hypothetical protein